MRYFDDCSSCTPAGSGSQNWFAQDDPQEVFTGRIYYKLSRDVRACALLYSNLIDSTFSDGSHSHAGFVPDSWIIHKLRAGAVAECAMDKAADPDAFTEILFNGASTKCVMPGEIFATDSFSVSAHKGEYLCVEISFSGRRVPCHTESILPSFRQEGRAWVHCTDIPFPSMIGAKRTHCPRVGFLGDSITQGIGTTPNAYAHFAAVIQEMLSERCCVWNLGLGYGRAHDAALDSGWLYKTRQNDIVCVCFGVNDLYQTGDTEQIKRDLTTILRTLKNDGVRTVIQTVPPFDYPPELRAGWAEVNNYIRNTLAKEADAIFDNVPILSVSEEQPYASRYGAHPNDEGNAAWALALAPVIEKLLF